MPLFYEIALTQQDLLSWDDIPDNVTDEIKIIKLLIRDKLLAQKRFKESNANAKSKFGLFCNSFLRISIFCSTCKTL